MRTPAHLETLQISKSKVLLRWAGSKRKLLPILATYRPEGEFRYVEPFAGSAALFFHLQPPSALLADTNSELISTYRTVKHSPLKTAQALSRMPEGDANYYYRLRKQSATGGSAARNAARFIYLNRYCFNGLYRTNLSGRFNVPYGGSRSGRLPDAEVLRSAAKGLRAATLITADFRHTLSLVREGDFVYLDPPYWVPERRVFREYSKNVFDAEAVDALAEGLERLEKLRIPFVLSYADSSTGAALGRFRRSKRVLVQRQIAGFSNSRRFAAELIITPLYVNAP